MNLDKLFAWVVGTVIAFSATGQIDILQKWIWKAQDKVIYESRSSQWGSPRLFKSLTPKVGKRRHLARNVRKK